MGGFISSAGYPVVALKQLEDADLGSEFLKAIQNIDKKDIKDKSKGDVLSKGVALAQGIWFITQCLARVHQGLVVTELEVATLAFAVVNVVIWLLWWNKPLDVQRPIVIGPPKSPDAQPIVPHQRPRLVRFSGAITGDVEGDDDYDPRLSTSVPSFWSGPIDNNPHHGTLGITALAGSVFGAIHCTAWNTDFPTTAEMYIWQSGSIVIISTPVVIFLVCFFDAIINGTAFEKTKLANAISRALRYVALVGFPIYIVARLILIALPLTALRSLPPSAFVGVNWSTYIPHI